MHALVTGANGYIGQRLIRALLDGGHEITATVRDRHRFPADEFGADESRLHVVEADFLDADSLGNLPSEVDADKVDAVFRKGVLTVTLPKKGGEKARKRISVKTH